MIGLEESRSRDDFVLSMSYVLQIGISISQESLKNKHAPLIGIGNPTDTLTNGHIHLARYSTRN